MGCGGHSSQGSSQPSRYRLTVPIYSLSLSLHRNRALTDVCRRAATLEDRMHHLETLIQAIPPAVFAAGGTGAAIPHSPIDPSTNPHASFASSTHIFPTAMPPPSLNSYPLMNPSTFFAPVKTARNVSPHTGFGSGQNGMSGSGDGLGDDSSRVSLSSNYLYFDDEGYTRWQGETSGLPLLDLLVERHTMTAKPEPDRMPQAQSYASQNGHAASDWFPDRTPKRTDHNPEAIWKLITSFIAPELMDRWDNTFCLSGQCVECLQSGAMFPVHDILPATVFARPNVPFGGSRE